MAPAAARHGEWIIEGVKDERGSERGRVIFTMPRVEILVLRREDDRNDWEESRR